MFVQIDSCDVTKRAYYTYTANSLKLVLRKKILVSRIIFLKSSKIISSLLQDNYLDKIS